MERVKCKELNERRRGGIFVKTGWWMYCFGWSRKEKVGFEVVGGGFRHV